MSKKPGANIIFFLRKPYPHQQNRWIILILVPLFISLFMVTFQPFGLQFVVHENKSLLLVGYGLVTFIVLGLDMYILRQVFPKLFLEERWMIISEVLFQSLIVLSIAAGNYLYSVLFSIASWSGITGFLIFIIFTFAVAIIPIVGIFSVGIFSLGIFNIALYATGFFIWGWKKNYPCFPGVEKK